MQVVSRKLKVNISLIIRYWVRLVIAMNGILFSRHMKYETQSIRKQSLIIFMIFISLFVASHFMTHHHCRIMPWKQCCRFILHTYLHTFARNGSNAKAVPFITIQIMTKMRFWFRCWFHGLAQLNQQLYSIDLTSGCGKCVYFFFL